MREPRSKPARTPSSEALWRFLIIGCLLITQPMGRRRPQLFADVAAAEHFDWDGRRRAVAARSLYRWVAAYREHGMLGLERASRAAAKASTVLSEAFLAFIALQKKADAETSVPEVIRRARQQGIVAPLERTDRTSVWRACRRLGVSTQRVRHRDAHRAARRFSLAHRLQMVVCDGKHFRAGAAQLKRVALTFLDDATRYALHVEVGPSESSALFLRGLYQVVRRYGVFDVLYLDRGPGFIALDTVAAMAQLGIPLIHGKAAYPEGRGKIERYHRTLVAQLLRTLTRDRGVDPSFESLAGRLTHYNGEVYNKTGHESLDQDTPQQRWLADSRALTPIADDTLDAAFVLAIRRRVSADHVVSIDSIDYETPAGYAGQWIELRRALLTGAVDMLHQERLIRLHPVDPQANARERRGSREAAPEPTGSVPPSAAETAYSQDHPSLLDPTDGFRGEPEDDLPF